MEITQEELIYEQLLGVYHSCPQSKNQYDSTDESSIWEQFNDTVISLVSLGHKNYEKFKIIPKISSYNGTQHANVNISALRMSMMSVLRMVGAEFRCGDPGSDLSRYDSASNFSVNQTANPINSASSHQKQTQQQQNILTVEQYMSKLQNIVDRELTEDQISQVSDSLEAFKHEPTKWQHAQKLILAGATFTKDVAVQFIGTVMAAMAAAGVS